MNRELLAEQLNVEIDKLMIGPTTVGNKGGLGAIAQELKLLPSKQFRQRLKDELLMQAETVPANSSVGQSSPMYGIELMPTLERREFSFLPADPRSFLFSFLSHAAAVVLLASGIWVTRTVVKHSPVISELTYIPMPLGQNAPHGGGGGGDHSNVEVSRGTPPKFSETQLAPPVIVVRNPTPKLQAEPTVLGPPQIKLPQSNHIGDLLSSNVTIPSNGSGGSGGMGKEARKVTRLGTIL